MHFFQPAIARLSSSIETGVVCLFSIFFQFIFGLWGTVHFVDLLRHVWTEPATRSRLFCRGLTALSLSNGLVCLRFLFFFLGDKDTLLSTLDMALYRFRFSGLESSSVASKVRNKIFFCFEGAQWQSTVLFVFGVRVWCKMVWVWVNDFGRKGKSCLLDGTCSARWTL